MAGAQDSALAIAVSNAGGVGSLPCAMLSAAQMRAELTAIEAGTDRPFNVNLFCHTPPVPRAERESIWRKTLEPCYRELGLDQNLAVTATQRAPFTAEAADILEDFRPSVVSFHFGLPSPPLLARVRSWARKFFVLPQQWTKRSGSKHVASMPSSRKDSKPVAIAAIFCRTISPDSSPHLRLSRRSCRR